MNRFEKWSVLATAVATAVTGFAYLWVRYGMVSDDPWSVVNHPIQPWLLKAHILLSPFLVFAVGSIAIRHVWRHYRSGMMRGRRSGVVAGYSILPMVVSGYLIQSTTDERLLNLVVIVHIVASVLFTAGAGAHIVLMMRSLRRERAGAVARPLGPQVDLPDAPPPRRAYGPRSGAGRLAGRGSAG